MLQFFDAMFVLLFVVLSNDFDDFFIRKNVYLFLYLCVFSAGSIATQWKEQSGRTEEVHPRVEA